MLGIYILKITKSDERNQEDLNKWWKYTVLMDQKMQNVKLPIFPNLIYRFNKITI